jgi:hypothetical protein
MDSIQLLVSLKKDFETKKRKEGYLQDVKINGLDLQFIPVEEQTYEICKAAILQNKRAYEYIRPDLKSFRFWMVAHVSSMFGRFL